MSVEVSNFLTPEELPAQLPTKGLGLVDRPELLVKRLLALQAIECVRMGGPDGPIMIAVPALQAYLRRGCPLLAPPAINGDWVGGGKGSNYIAGELTSLVIAKCSEGLPALDKNSEDGSTVRLGVSAGVRQVLNRPLPPPIPDSGNKPLPYNSYGECYLCGRFQKYVQDSIAESQAADGVYGSSQLNFLYRDSATFEKLIKAGWSKRSPSPSSRSGGQ